MSTHPEPTAPPAFTPEQAADIAQIQQRVYYYGWCIDHRRFDDLDQLFLPHTEIHYDVPGGTKGPWSEMKAWLPAGLSQFRLTQHNMTNVLIQLDGDSATSSTYGDLLHLQELTDGSTSTMRHHAIYRDRWERIDGIWRILARTLSHLAMVGVVHDRSKVVDYDAPSPV